MSTLHELKTWPLAFDAICTGEKSWEVRRNDRDYTPGDRLRLREWDPPSQFYPSGAYTGQQVERIVVYVHDLGQYGSELAGFVGMSLVAP